MKTPIGNFRVPEAKGTQDFFGLNYYSVDTVKFDLTNPKEMFGRRYYPADSDFSGTNFIANIPTGIFDSLKWITKMYPGLPILITENGVEDADDKMRPRYLAQHLQQVWRAVNYNWPVKGYFHWSLVDNFEWERGWKQRFGLWGLDVETQVRIRRPSVDLYAEICKENGLSSAMVAKYCPEAMQKIFPD
jgi:beta-glucosidase